MRNSLIVKTFARLRRLVLAAGIFLAALPCLAQDTGMVRHFVAFKFKEDATPQDIAAINAALLSLQGKIDGIISMERGDNNSPENLNQGFTDGFLITFQDAASRDTYLKHPEHLAFLKIALPKIAQAFVFDYTPAQK